MDKESSCCEFFRNSSLRSYQNPRAIQLLENSKMASISSSPLSTVAIPVCNSSIISSKPQVSFHFSNPSRFGALKASRITSSRVMAAPEVLDAATTEVFVLLRFNPLNCIFFYFKNLFVEWFFYAIVCVCVCVLGRGSFCFSIECGCRFG